MSVNPAEKQASDRLLGLIAEHTASVAKTVEDCDFERFLANLRCRVKELTELLRAGQLQGWEEEYARKFAARWREQIANLGDRRDAVP